MRVLICTPEQIESVIEEYRRKMQETASLTELMVRIAAGVAVVGVIVLVASGWGTG